GVEVFREQVGVLMRADRSLVAIGGRLSPAPDASLAKSAAAQTALQIGEREAVARALADYEFAEAATASELQASGRMGGYSFYALPAAARSSSGAQLTQPA